MNKKNEIGKNAGIVWELLNTKGELNLTEMYKITKLSEVKIAYGIAWLFSEDKLYYNEKTKKFGLKGGN